MILIEDESVEEKKRSKDLESEEEFELLGVENQGYNSNIGGTFDKGAEQDQIKRFGQNWMVEDTVNGDEELDKSFLAQNQVPIRKGDLSKQQQVEEEIDRRVKEEVDRRMRAQKFNIASSSAFVPSTVKKSSCLESKDPFFPRNERRPSPIWEERSLQEVKGSAKGEIARQAFGKHRRIWHFL